MLPFRVLPKSLVMHSAVQSKGFDWYVDSVNGNDANSGKSKSAPLQTISALLGVMAAGETAGLARGSHWRDKLLLPGDNSQARAYGSGAHPIFDASNVVAGGSWSKTGGQTNVYQASVTPDWGLSVDYLNVWEDDAFLTRAANLGACDSIPGSYFPSAGSGTITLYVHPNGSTNPTSDGKTYEYSHRQTGIDCYNYSGCIVSGIETRKQLVTRGSLVLGRFCTAINCLAKWGNSHNIFLKAGARALSCRAQEAYYTVQAPVLFVAYETDPEDLDVLFYKCTAELASISANNTGFAAHTDSVNAFSTCTFQDCTTIKCFNGFTGDDCAAIVANNLICKDTTKPIITSNASPWTIDGLTVTGAITRVIEM
jgi:hypothetical protein